eukprot:233595-Amphidinium_carterae.1
MGQRERTRKEKQAAARAASATMRTVQENTALLPDNEMEVDADGADTSASAAAASSELQSVLRVREASREPSGPVTAPPGGSGGDGGATQSAKRKEKEKEAATSENVNPSGVVHPLPPGPLTLGASSSSQG